VVRGFQLQIATAATLIDTAHLRAFRAADDTDQAAAAGASSAISAGLGCHAVVDPLVNQEVYGKALLGIPYEDNITPLI
jgi:hypothetical protein